MLLPANYCPDESTTVVHRINWVEDYLNPRAQKLVAIYFAKQAVESLFQRSKHMDWFTKIVTLATKTLEDGEDNALEFSQDSEKLEQLAEPYENPNSPQTTMAMGLLNFQSIFYQKQYTAVPALCSLLNQMVETHALAYHNNNCMPVAPLDYEEGSFRDHIPAFQAKQNRELALFAPVKKWKYNWRTANTVALAKAIYEEQAWERSPILADALMDEGCEHEVVIDILRNHHKSFGRGVWVIDKLCGYR